MNNEEAIRELAYQKWAEAGYPESDGVEFWLLAEQELAPPISTKHIKAKVSTPKVKKIKKAAAEA